MPERAEPHPPRIGPPQVVGTVLLLGVLGATVHGLATGPWDAVCVLFLGTHASLGIAMVTSPVQPGSDRTLLFSVSGMSLIGLYQLGSAYLAGP